MLAGPPAFRLMSKSAVFFLRPKGSDMPFKFKLSVRLALMKDRRPRPPVRDNS